MNHYLKTIYRSTITAWCVIYYLTVWVIIGMLHIMLVWLPFVIIAAILCGIFGCAPAYDTQQRLADEYVWICCTSLPGEYCTVEESNRLKKLGYGKFK